VLKPCYLSGSGLMDLVLRRSIRSLFRSGFVDFQGGFFL
jgi:hypothetical protein